MGLPPDQDRPKVRIPPPHLFFLFLCVASALEYGIGLDYPREPIRARGFIDPNKPTTQIVEDGPFRFSRNPMYLSLVLVLLALMATSRYTK